MLTSPSNPYQPCSKQLECVTMIFPCEFLSVFVWGHSLSGAQWYNLQILLWAPDNNTTHPLYVGFGENNNQWCRQIAAFRLAFPIFSIWMPICTPRLGSGHAVGQIAFVSRNSSQSASVGMVSLCWCRGMKCMGLGEIKWKLWMFSFPISNICKSP